MKRKKYIVYIIIDNIIILITACSLIFFYLGSIPNKYIRLKRGELSENVDTNVQWDGICFKYKTGSNDYKYLFIQNNLDEINNKFGTKCQLGDKVWILYFVSTHLMAPPVIGPIFIF